MKTLIIGGTGLVGGHAAILLGQQGHEVTLAARSAPQSPALQEFRFRAIDYVDTTLEKADLEGFDGLVFAAAQDVRQLPQDGSESPEQFYQRVNNEAVPRFFAVARDAGISQAVYIGSFYPQIAPQQIERDPYVYSRHVTDQAVRALASDQFSVCSINAPFILGSLPGLQVPHLAALKAYVSGLLPDLPLFAPQGGTNHISARSVAQAIHGALQHGEPGKAYLVGDENLTWKEYLEQWAAAAGHSLDLEVKPDDHPMLPHSIMFAGPNALVSYEPDAGETALLAYDRQQIAAEIQRVVNDLP